MATEIDQSKLEKLNAIKEKGVNPYPYSFDQTHHAKEINEKYSSLGTGEQTEFKVAVAGRIMLKRVMGKAAFYHIQDQTGRVQIYLQQNALGAENYKLLTKKLDLGDIIGVNGLIFKTKLGEVTINAHKAEILCKTLLPMPEKFHGLKDEELRYRNRHVDLTVNPEVKEIFEKRSKMIGVIRDYFDEKGFMEVEVPTLHTIYGGANARPFVTHINAWKMPMYMSISPELFLKKLLVGGFEKVYSICKNFRNEDVDTTHNPEFTMLEIYQAYVDYNTMMKYLEEVYEKACIAINGSTKVKQTYQGKEVEIDFKAPWKRLTMKESLKEYADIDFDSLSDEELETLVRNYNVDVLGDLTRGKMMFLLFEELVEDKLIQPVHIIDHPKESTPLCKKKRGDDLLIERFESFCKGMELSNAYSELNDPVLQRELLEEQANQLRGGQEEAHPMDEGFANSIEFGMPPAGGLGFGIDRMIMMLTGVESIRDVILFPTMKPISLSNDKVNKSKDTKIVVAIINRGAKMEKWQEMNTIAHLNAAFAARKGSELFYQDTIITKDNKEINLNIQHAIMIKEVDSNAEVINLVKESKDLNFEVAEFTREMIETTDDAKIIEITKQKDFNEVEFLGALIFGKKSSLQKLTAKLRLYGQNE